ncbi:aminotransferase class III-fold pyridoxal phosphate-dependent enzyme [Bradyrhizobium tunisiense]|uniref:aminotransferase class III-fold pyridoxal phosphate-dependent enzyme n=1 Tax=Bradyrhizobium tunisiense TaxID=3278709 RepID=UPI0035E00026
MCALRLVPDLFTFGKIIGGGLPIGAIGGSRDVVSVFDTSNAAAGTFAANRLSMVAGLASMKALDQAAFTYLETLGERLRGQLQDAIAP